MYIVYIPKSPIDIVLPKIHTETKAQEALISLAREYIFQKEGPEKSEQAKVCKMPEFPKDNGNHCIVQSAPHSIEVHKKLSNGWVSGYYTEKVYELQYAYCPDAIKTAIVSQTPSSAPLEAPKIPAQINPFILELTEAMEKRRIFIENDDIESSSGIMNQKE